jgi:hypothetical protein
MEMASKSRIKLFTVVLASGVMMVATAGGGYARAGILPVHGSPSMSGGVLVTHGTLRLGPLPVRSIVRDHRSGYIPGRCGGAYRPSNPGNCAPGGIIGGTPAQYAGPLPQGGQVRDHRHLGGHS